MRPTPPTSAPPPTGLNIFAIFAGIAAMSAKLVANMPGCRGLHSSTFRLTVSAFCGIGGAFRDCSAGVLGVLEGIRGIRVC